MRTSGFLALPSEKTLRDNYFKSRSGYHVEVNRQLQKEAKVSTLPESQKFCALIIDEMKIKENLVYDKYTGEILDSFRLVTSTMSYKHLRGDVGTTNNSQKLPNTFLSLW